MSTTPWEITHRLVEAINAHDLHRVLECYSPDAVLVTPAGLAEGHEQIAWFYEDFFEGFPDFHQTAWFEGAGDDPVSTEWTLTGTHTGPFLLPDGSVMEGTGRHVTVRASCTAHVTNGKIITHREYFDQLELYSQLGFGLAELDLPCGLGNGGEEAEQDELLAGGVVDSGQRSGWRGRLLRSWPLFAAKPRGFAQHSKAAAFLHRGSSAFDDAHRYGEPR